MVATRSMLTLVPSPNLCWPLQRCFEPFGRLKPIAVGVPAAKALWAELRPIPIKNKKLALSIFSNFADSRSRQMLAFYRSSLK